MTILGVFLRFVLGGAAVAAVAVVAKKLGGRIGGIFAAFPAVYASAVIAAVVGLSESAANRRTLAISHGALLGMLLSVGCAILAGWAVAKFSWKKGLLLALSGWLLAAGLVFIGGTALGWLR